MSTKLEKLIVAYEAERISLTTEMGECAAEMDYGRAHLFFKALVRLNRQLQTLYNLQDKWHDEKADLMHSEQLFGKRMADAEDYMRAYYAQYLANKKEKLAKPTQAPAQKASIDPVVRGMLGRLLVGELIGFTLVLRKSKRLYCHLKLVRKTLILTIPEVRRHKDNYTLEKRHLKRIKQLGFSLYDNKDKLMLFAPYSTIEDADAIQRLLARITFEVFYFKDLAGETYIKYYP